MHCKISLLLTAALILLAGGPALAADSTSYAPPSSYSAQDLNMQGHAIYNASSVSANGITTGEVQDKTNPAYYLILSGTSQLHTLSVASLGVSYAQAKILDAGTITLGGQTRSIWPTSLWTSAVWHDLTGSRTPGNVYCNSTGAPIQLSIDVESTANSGASGPGYLYVGPNSGAVTTQVTRVQSVDNNRPEFVTWQPVIPASACYVVTGHVTVQHWSELWSH